MCETEMNEPHERFDEVYFPEDDKKPNTHDHHLSRRGMLGLVGGLAGAAIARNLFGDQMPAYADNFTGSVPIRSAMHVHASWSEGPASWAATANVAKNHGVETVFMTDHDYRMLGNGYWTNLDTAPFIRTTTGSLSQSVGTKSGGTLLITAESSNSTPASVTMKLNEASGSNIKEKFRTSIGGTILRPDFKQTNLSGGATVDMCLTLSKHPAAANRPAGTLTLVYRFGNGLTPNKWFENNGLTAVVARPLPTIGTKGMLDLESDVKGCWPDIEAYDNSTYGLSVVARSPRRGAVANVQLSCQIDRTGHTENKVAAYQQALAEIYKQRYGITLYPSAEIGRSDHFNGFSVPQYIPDQSLNTGATRDAFYRNAVQAIHERGGLLSWNHPFGSDSNVLLSKAEQNVERRERFAYMMGKNLYGKFDIIEVGYTSRGQADTFTHMDLWDTFTRNGILLTGNGVNDDHGAGNWSSLKNGFMTGIWSSSSSHAALVEGLRKGRAYTAHLGKYPGAQMDLLVDGTVPMGAVSLGHTALRTIEIQALNLPAGSRVELVGGPIDYSGNDPGSTVLETFPSNQFGVSGIAKTTIDNASSAYYRTQVISSSGDVIGISNPVHLLREAPGTNIPQDRVTPYAG